jgi:uncharacterized protein with FMN-binding domain
MSIVRQMSRRAHARRPRAREFRRAAALPTVGLVLAACGPGSVTSSNRPVTLPPSSTSASSARLRAGTYTGQLVQTRYGPVQVELTATGGRVTSITFLAVPVDRPRSRSISTQAEPLLRSEALTAQSAEVNLLSGATYTSEGFAQSLQSALAQAR